MCVIVHIGAKKSISKALLQTCYQNNPDGWGIMFAVHGKLQIVKEKSSFDNFYNIFKDVPREVERALHFRIRTSGNINTDNCHPFRINDNMGMMHNGTIDTHFVQKDMSDTFNYCEYELKPVVAGWPNCIDDESFASLVEETTGWSKLLFMDSDGKVLKTRLNVWTERNGLFFSNANSLYASSTNYTSNRSSSYSGSNYNNGYGPVTNNAFDKYEPIKSEPQRLISDLYSGNKTDDEGQSFVASNREEEDREQLQAKIAAALSKNMADPTEEKEDDEEETFTLDFEQLMSMSNEDMLDWVQDYPRSAVYVLNGLVDTLTQAGIFEIQEPVKKSAVNG